MFCSSWGSYRCLYWFFYIPTIENMSFHLAHFKILGSMEFGKTRNDCFHCNASKNNMKLNKHYAKKISNSTSIEIQIQHWGGNRQSSMEVTAIEYFPSLFDPGNNEEKYEFHSYISDENEQYACDSHAHMFHR